MLDCTTPDYRRLYRRWVARHDGLLDLAEWTPEQALLDLCGGTGVVAAEAAARGGMKISLLDRNPRCSPYIGRAGDANYPQHHYESGSFDVIVCRQGIAYLDLYKIAAGAVRVLKPGGRMVFNSFLEPERKGFKTYRVGKITYAEGHVFGFGWVLHLQALVRGDRPGMDLSLFKYHTPDEIRAAFEPLFIRVDVFRKGTSLRWRMTK